MTMRPSTSWLGTSTKPRVDTSRSGERLGVGHMRERTVQAIGPAVVAAHQGAGAAGLLDEGETAMPARVAEHPRPLVAPPHGE